MVVYTIFFMALANTVEARFYKDHLGPLSITGISVQNSIDLGADDAHVDEECLEKAMWLWANKVLEHGASGIFS